MIAKYKLPPPLGAVIPSFYRSDTQTPLIALPSRGFLRFTSVDYFQPVKPPPFPFDDDQELLEEGQRPYRNNDFEGDQVTVLPCIDLKIRTMADGTALDVPEKIEMTACAFGDEGRLLIGVSKGQGLWIWRLHSDESQLRRVNGS